MATKKLSRKRLAIDVIPILIGLGGLIFSRELEDLVIRVIVVLMSVSVPLFAGGHLLARYRASRLERLILLAGVLMLILGAGYSVSGISDTLAAQSRISETILNASRYIGMLSLMLGLFVVLLIVVRTGEDIEEFGERFWHLAKHISEGFVLSSPQGTVYLVNQQFLDMFDLKERDVLGRSTLELVEELNIGPLRAHIEHRSRGIASEYEVTWRVRGEDRRFWFNGLPIYDRQGRHTATLATVRDITEHHRL